VIWESPARISEAGSIRKMVLLFFLNKLLAYLLVVGTALLLIASFIANLLIRAVIGLVNHFQEQLDFIQQVDELLLTRGLQVSASVFILSVTLCVIFKLLPTVRPQWRDVWLGAIITALMLVGLQQFATGGVVSVSSKFLSYGVVGSVMILMLWIFLAFQIVLVGCEFSYVYAHLYGSRRSAAQEVMP
jgi:membrane protein